RLLDAAAIRRHRLFSQPDPGTDHHRHFGIILEKLLISRMYKLDHLYGLLLTFGMSLVIEGLFRNYYGSSGMPYRIPEILQGATNLGFMYLPNYRGWVVLAALVVCLATWAILEKTSLGATLRAA